MQKQQDDEHLPEVFRLLLENRNDWYFEKKTYFIQQAPILCHDKP